MARKGPGYITTEAEMFDDVEQKLADGKITEDAVRTFTDLYEFAQEIGDAVDVSGVKNARIKLVVDAHQGNSGRNPGIFTANVSNNLKIWPAGMPIIHDYLELVSWEEDIYRTYQRSFQSLYGLPRDTNTIQFDAFVNNDTTDEFKDIVAEFVAACRAADR